MSNQSGAKSRFDLRLKFYAVTPELAALPPVDKTQFYETWNCATCGNANTINADNADKRGLRAIHILKEFVGAAYCDSCNAEMYNFHAANAPFPFSETEIRDLYNDWVATTIELDPRHYCRTWI